MEQEGPKHWARLRLLQACERLKIPVKLWPEFGSLMLPREYKFHCCVGEKYEAPSFRRLYESESEWRQRARDDFEKFLDKHATTFREWLKWDLDRGSLTRIKPTRDTAPLDLRYEWAARRYCEKKLYKEMATDEYSADRIRKTVRAIFIEIGLQDHRK